LKNSQLILRLANHAKGTYFVLLLIYPMLTIPEALTGLIAKGVIDVLQGAPSLSFLYGNISISVGQTVSQRMDVGFMLIWVLVGINVIHVIPYFAGYYWFVRLRLMLIALLIRNMLISVYRLPGAVELFDTPGEAISRFRGDTEQAAQFIFSSQDVASSLLVGIIAMVLLMTANPSITAIVFLPLLVVVIAAHVASARVEKYREASRKTTGDVTSIIGEVFGAVQAVQVACAEDRVIRHFRKYNEIRRKAGLKDLLFSNILGAVFNGVSTVGLGLVLLLVGKEMRKGTFSAGDFALFQYYLPWIMGIPGSLGGFLIQAKQAGVSMRRLVEMLHGDPPAKLVEHAPTCLWGKFPEIPVVVKRPEDRLESLEASALTYRHSSSGKGIEGVDIRIDRGSFVVITG